MSAPTRRTIITGIGAMIAAPALVRSASLMPVRGIIMAIPKEPIPPSYLGAYKLVGRTVVPVSLQQWSGYFEEADRRVASDVHNEVHVSTVFLGLDHNFSRQPGSTPLVFESMVFGGKLDGDMRRYSTWDEAERGHKEMLAEVRRATMKIVKG